MKSKYHLIKNKVHVQLTDGSILKISMFSKISKLKLNLDIRSSILWKFFFEKIASKNYKIFFLKKFFKT
jgi:hypothetical protein